ncbi:MAG: hypothetical protein V4606_01605, partial [Patescibacteria group bacterium]
AFSILIPRYILYGPCQHVCDDRKQTGDKAKQHGMLFRRLPALLKKRATTCTELVEFTETVGFEGCKIINFNTSVLTK